MDSAKGEEKRDCVRATLSAEVEFSIVDSHEYQAIIEERKARPRASWGKDSQGIAPRETEDDIRGGAVESSLIDFLIQMDDKLDRVLRLLSKYEGKDQELFLGQALDIGGGGMRILCDKAVDPGQVLEVRCRISRYPAVSLDVLAKVSRVRETKDAADGRYDVALEFLDLEEESRESIFAYVFQMQREAIRSKKE